MSYARYLDLINVISAKKLHFSAHELCQKCWDQGDNFGDAGISNFGHQNAAVILLE